MQDSNLPERDKNSVLNAIKERCLPLKKSFDEEIAYLQKINQKKSSTLIKDFFETDYPIAICDEEYHKEKIKFCLISMYQVDKSSFALLLKNIPDSIKKIILKNLTCDNCQGHGLIRCVQCIDGLCKQCGGRGRIHRYSPVAGYIESVCNIKCVICDGTGKRKCEKCDGYGIKGNRNSLQLKLVSFENMQKLLLIHKKFFDKLLIE